MITNEREYRITSAQRRRLELGLASSGFEQPPADVDPVLVAASRAALEAEIAELSAQLEEYEQVKSGRKRLWSLDALGGLPEVIIQARIASGLTQKRFAEILGVHEQQVQRSESTRYRGATFTRLEQCAEAAGLRLQVFAVQGSTDYAMSPRAWPTAPTSQLFPNIFWAGTGESSITSGIMPTGFTISAVSGWGVTPEPAYGLSYLLAGSAAPRLQLPDYYAYSPRSDPLAARGDRRPTAPRVGLEGNRIELLAA